MKKRNKRLIFEYNPDVLAGNLEKDTDPGMETPVMVADQMATQVSVDQPPIEDENYVPASPKELANAAQVVAKRCPQDQVSFFYKHMLDLVEKAIDKSRQTPENLHIEEEEEMTTPINVKKEAKNRVAPRLIDYIIYESKNKKGVYMSEYGARQKDAARKWKQGDRLDLYRGDEDYDMGDDEDVEFHPDAEDLMDFMAANDEDDASKIYGATPETAEQANQEYSLADILKTNVYPGASRESAIHNKIERDMFPPLRMVKSAPQVSDRLIDLIKSKYGADAFLDSMYHADLLSDKSIDDLEKNPESLYGSSIYGYFTSIAFVRPTVKQLEKLAELGPDVFDFKRKKSQISPDDAERIIQAVKDAWERKSASQKSKIAQKAVKHMSEFENRDKSVMG